jgi:ADP-ribose pyrophosphatase
VQTPPNEKRALMEKPKWRVRSSSYVVDSPFMRLRKDEIELPNGTVLPEYFVRESVGYSLVVAMTRSREIVMVRQYRYAPDVITLELPAGGIDADEDPMECAKRELLEETGYTSPRWEALLNAYPEPVRSDAVAYAFIAYDAEQTHELALDPGESINVECYSIEDTLGLMRTGKIHTLGAIAALYSAFDRIGVR